MRALHKLEMEARHGRAAHAWRPPMSKELRLAPKAITKKPRGAPRKTFVHDPERFAIARADIRAARSSSMTVVEPMGEILKQGAIKRRREIRRTS
jgi:hypothetical protein